MPSPKTDPAKCHRLWACAASLGLVGLVEIWRVRENIAGLAVHVLGFPVLIWIAWMGAHRSPFLHRLWGGVCLVGSVAMLAMLTLGLFGLREFRPDQISLGLVDIDYQSLSAV